MFKEIVYTTASADPSKDYIWEVVVPPSGNLSSIDRIDYSNDSATATPKGNRHVQNYHTAVGNVGNYGLLCWWWRTK